MSLETSEAVALTKIIHSPDDGGYWIDQWSSEKEKSRASVKIYRSLAEAKRALEGGRVRWESWD